jgi:hypothetical protein
MLFVWLMSFGIGVANACLIDQDHGSREYGRHGHAGISLDAIPKSHRAHEPVAASSVHSDENRSAPEKVACLDFCADEQSTLVSGHVDGPVHPELAPVLFLSDLLVPVSDQTAPPQAFANPTSWEPPVSIRYLRLTI